MLCLSGFELYSRWVPLFQIPPIFFLFFFIFLCMSDAQRLLQKGFSPG